MVDERTNAPGADPTLTVRMSAQPAFFDTVAALASCLGQRTGCPPGEAARFGEAVALALGHVVTDAPPGATPAELDVAFQAAARWLRADVWCGSTRQGGVFPLEQTLAGDRLDGLRSLVDRAEVVQDRGRACCRLTRQFRAR